MGPIHETTVDGVTVFWTPDAFRLSGTLMFRVGRTDETLVHSGLTHLVEHLALFGLGARQAYEFNGSVNGLHLEFSATGSADELVAFFAQVCAALRSLPLGRLETEARVLRTEANGRSTSSDVYFLWCRYGARGHGVTFYPEYALWHPDPSAVVSWAADHFTAGNATAWFSGPIPPGLRFDLPGGPRIPVPDLHPIAGLPLPAWAIGPGGAVSIAMIGPRADQLYIPIEIARLRISQRLRFEKGLAYKVEVGYEVLARDTAHTYVIAMTLDEHAKVVHDDVLEILGALALDGPTEAELGAAADDFERREAAPEAILRTLGGRAFSELMGIPWIPVNEVIDGIRKTNPAAVAQVIDRALQTALAIGPSSVGRFDPSYRPYPMHSARAVLGRRHRSVRAPFPWSDRLPELIVADDGVSVVDQLGKPWTVKFAEVAVAVERRDKSLELIGLDGFRVFLHPFEWRSGKGVFEHVRASIPDDSFVRQPEIGGT